MLISAAVQNVKTRTITFSVNMSLTMDEQRQRPLLCNGQAQQRTRPSITAAVLRSCMKETELSMAELRRFRLSLLSHEPQEANAFDESTTEQPSLGEMADADFSEEEDIDGIVYETESAVVMEPTSIAVEHEEPVAFKIDGKSDESLQCFAYCLYEQLGLISKGVYMEEELFAKLYAVVGRERHLVKECMDLNTNNKCESSYKMHLCYARLKTLEAEKRLHDVLGPIEGEEKDREEVEMTQKITTLESVETTMETEPNTKPNPTVEADTTLESKSMMEPEKTMYPFIFQDYAEDEYTKLNMKKKMKKFIKKLKSEDLTNRSYNELLGR
ncbi:uncharacterized protein LOC101450519 [Ceratitis capitata]|uniref:uncharacterized protein LOC101450519 n=1 Tax=Ceratitis capitata TaxID=7213 RepID=UPI000A1017AD|nr:uncharacterized protein LOC101450519 [Ceratitis capitata]